MSEPRRDAAWSGSNLPTTQRPFQQRPIFVLVGMHRTGASILAQMLQLLGVSMTEYAPNPAAATSGNWERPEIAQFNDRLLHMLDRPLDSAIHTLPFPAGWWAGGDVHALKREARAYLQGTLEQNSDLWGFKDLRISRLLPFWQQIFDDLGLQPIYLWTVRDPAECVASAAGTGLTSSSEIAEAMWFIYNAEIQKYIGNDITAVIDFASWMHEPGDVVHDLLQRLPLRWRGSKADLLECIGNIAPSRQTQRNLSRIRSPLVQPFYDAICDREQSEASLRYRASITQALDILRTLVAPYTSLVRPANQNDPGLALRAPTPLPDPSVSEPPPPELPSEPSSGPTSGPLAKDLHASMAHEIEARIHENAWLQQKYEAQIRDLEAQFKRQAALLAKAESEKARLSADRDARDGEISIARQKLATLKTAHNGLQGEMEKLRKDFALQKTASEKYLSRIYELKAMQKSLENCGKGVPAKDA